MTISTEYAQKLRQQTAGTVFTPDDADYQTARLAWNLAVDQHPALILVAENAADVATGAKLAREAGLGVAAQVTGHGVQQPANDALLILTSRLKGVQVNAEARTARVGAGVLWHEVVEQAAPHGLAPLLGSSPHVGVVGYTLGGGIGWLARRYGLAADSVRSIEVVTADGELRHASPDENSDLFWALRGGGVNFGVVTALEFALYPVATIYGGFLAYPGELAREALGFFRDWTASAPDELTSSIAIVNFPSMPQLPEAIRGKTQVILRAAYTGDAAEGAAYVQKWLDWQTPLTNTFHEMPFAEIGTINNDPVNPTAGYGANEMFARLSDEALDIITRHATNKASPLVFSELRHAGGAIARVAPDANAIGNRDVQYYFQVGGPLFAPNAKAAAIDYIRQYKADLKPHLHGGVFLNFNAGGEVYNRARDAYLPESYRRLLALKAKYDPDNRFRYGYQLVTPVAEPT
jgi:FAD/FMN-containing dehydrogenase